MRHLPQRELDHELRAWLGSLRAQRQRATVVVDRLLGEWEYKSSTIRLCREEGLQDLGSCCGLNSLAAVGHAEADPAIAARGSHPERSTLRHRVDRIEDEV